MPSLKRTSTRILAAKGGGGVLFFLFFLASACFGESASQPPKRNARPETGYIDIATPPPQGQIEVGVPIFVTTAFSDPDGSQDLAYVEFLVNTSDTDIDGFLARYYLTTNKLFLRQDKKWFGGIAPGTNQTIATSQGMLICQETQVKITNIAVIVTWKIVFNKDFFGHKNLYLFARDKTANGTGFQKKAEIDIYPSQSFFYTALSLDNLLSLKIHPQALKNLNDVENRLIYLRKLDTSNFKDKPVAEHSLVMAFECKPDGYSFNQGEGIPVPELTIKLPQTEIPGTQLKLYILNEKTNKFSPSGDTYTLGIDGYQAVFPIKHFSIYAILKPTINTPIGIGVKIPLPDLLTGSFSYSVPITVPPGRKGIQPSLSLNYRSSNPNSWTGLGFSLNPGYITRSTRLGPPAYTDDDTFYFITDAGTTELVRLIDNLYMAKVESGFTKFFKEADDSWQAQGKDGSIILFGKSPSAKELSERGTFSWYITRVLDTNANYVNYAYVKDGNSNKTYLTQVDYTGNTGEQKGLSLAPTHKVKFNLEDRTDKFSNYLSGSRISTEKRLKNIEVSINSKLVWLYELEYSLSPDTQRSLLKSVTQKGFDKDGKPIALPVQSFEYQKSSP